MQSAEVALFVYACTEACAPKADAGGGVPAAIVPRLGRTFSSD